MRVLVTGASGFIGAALVELLRGRGAIGPRPIESLILLDQRLPQEAPGVLSIEGDLGDRHVLARIAELAPEVCFHLAAVPGGAAEADAALSRRVNLDATLDLFDALAGARAAKDSPGPQRPVVVYASTIAVYGGALPDPVSDATPARPLMTYGAHKLACEVLLRDYTRRGLLDGRSLRLPGIVARPRTSSGLVSAFMSEVLHALRAGESVSVPVGPAATAWWMSARRCAQNLLHAAAMEVGDTLGAPGPRAWPMPVLRLSMADVVRTLSQVYAVDGDQLVRYAPQPSVEAVFGRYPRLDDSAARALGMRDDGSATALVRRALEAEFEDLAVDDPVWR